MRIPEVFWKIIFDPKDKKALAFIVFNSPCPWNTVLLNELKKSTQCSRDYCTTVTNHFGLKPKWSKNKQYDVLGMVFCCRTVTGAFNIFETDAKSNSIINELVLLPADVINANELVPVVVTTAKPLTTHVGIKKKIHKKRKRRPGH
jgi:hypothetical protein